MAVMALTYIQLGLFDHRDDVDVEKQEHVHRWITPSGIFPIRHLRASLHTLPMKVHSNVELMLSGARALAVVVDGFGYIAHRSCSELSDELWIKKHDLSLGLDCSYIAGGTSGFAVNIEATNETLLAIAPYESWIAIPHCFFPFSNENDAKKWAEKYLANEATV